MRHSFRAQGATEYLVLLAVVLVIGLVGVALLGFFPGTASDAQIAETKIYWQAASPIAITEYSDATVRFITGTYYHGLYFRIRNTGQYRITLSKIFGGGGYIDQYYSTISGSNQNMSTISLSPGEETCFYTNVFPYSTPCNKWIAIYASGALSAGDRDLHGNFATACDTQGKGALTIPDFAFEYTQYVEGQQITKTERGTKPFIAKCVGLA